MDIGIAWMSHSIGPLQQPPSIILASLRTPVRLPHVR